ncbi:MAG: Gp15 family bacteriophage protein [Ruthenibacterium sp.]
MYELYADLPKSVVFKRRTYALNLSFDNVLSCYSLLSDPRVLDADRLPWTVQKLAGAETKKLCEQDLYLLFETIFDTYINCTKRTASPKNKPKTLDFSCDSDLIYAAFMQTYQIDLFAEHGHLPWWKFYALLQGLPDSTKLRQVMRIRAQDIPSPNKYNAEEIKNLIEQKQYYALPDTVRGESYQAGLQTMWNTLLKQCR